MPESEVKQCRRNPSDRARTLAVRSLRTVGSVRNTNGKRTNATRSTTETLLYAVGMAERGNESVTHMLLPILYVRDANSKENLFRHKRCITSFLFPRAELTQETTLLLCVNPVTRLSTPSEVTDGTSRLVSNCSRNLLWVGVSKSLQPFARATGVGFRAQIRKSFQGNRPR